MTHTYTVTGMTCGSCEVKVKSSLLTVPNITNVEVSKEQKTATIGMEKHVPLSTLQAALSDKYSIAPLEHSEAAETAKSWLQTYKPVLLIFGFVLVVSLIGGYRGGALNGMEAMRLFMAGFFLTFSFFKLLDLSAFADSYAMYDVVAMRWRGWGFVYPFVELALGIAFAANFAPVLTNWVALVVMSVSLVGVLQSVMSKRTIKCACLGAVFNLPMSTVTIIEDGLMIAMSGAMLLTML